MCLDNFYIAIQGNEKNFISPQLEQVKINAIKQIKKCISEGGDKDKDSKINTINYSNTIYSKCKCLNKPKMIIYSLVLLSHIQNTFFSKDILIFYHEKVLPFLLFSIIY